MSADLTEDYDYLIYRSGSNFKVKEGAGSTTVSAWTNTDALPTFQAVRDAMGNAGKVCKIKSGSLYTFSGPLVFDDTNLQYQSWLGTGGRWSLPQLRASGNFEVFDITKSPIVEIKNLYLTHNVVGYNKGLIRLKDSNAEIFLNGLRFYSFGQNCGDAMVFELVNDLNQQYRIQAEGCQSYAMDNFAHFKANFSGTASNNFLNGFHFVGNWITNTKRICKVDGVSGGAASGHVWERNEYQYISSNDPGVGGAIFDYNGPGTISGQLRFSNNLIWDIPATVNMLNTNAFTEWDAVNSNFGRIGGSGFIEGKGRRVENLYYVREGTNTFSGNGLLKLFSVTHGLGYVPRKALIECGSDDIGVIHAHVRRDSSLTQSQMNVEFARPPPIGTNNIIIKWHVEA